MAEKLGALGPSVVHKCFDVLFEATHGVFHLAVPFFGTFEARLKIQVLLIYPLIFGSYSRALSSYVFILALLGSHSFVL